MRALRALIETALTQIGRVISVVALDTALLACKHGLFPCGEYQTAPTEGHGG
jgi:hypothetical protein